MNALAPALVLLALTAPRLAAQTPTPQPPSHLIDYVNKPDASYKWQKAGEPLVTPVATVHRLKLTSQTWHGVVWEHDLQLVIPTGVKLAGPVLLWNQGGSAEIGATFLATHLAIRAQAPVLFLYGVPKQPLFGGKREDALIAETFVKYLETGDPTWPLLFPMVKSVVRSMDALQEFAKQEFHADITEFIVSGASKRGWTTWLTAATGDKRVKAIIPMVIDVLNMPAQMKAQLEAFGGPSKMIADYTSRGLVPIPDSGRAKELWAMVDPYTYRAKYTMPKLVITGTNDPYWPLDAVKHYWDGLPGEKYLLTVPNAGHDLREVDEKGVRQGLPRRVGDTVAAFTRACRSRPSAANSIARYFFPWTSIERASQGGLQYLKVTVLGNATGLVQWTARSETRDFRKARWHASPMDKLTLGRDFVLTRSFEIPEPSTGFAATYIEMRYKFGDLEFGVTTPPVITEAKPE